MKRKIIKAVLMLFLIGILLSSCRDKKIASIQRGDDCTYYPVYIYEVSEVYYNDPFSAPSSTVKVQDNIYMVCDQKIEIGEVCSFAFQRSAKSSAELCYGVLKDVLKEFPLQKNSTIQTYIISYYSYTLYESNAYPNETYNPAFLSLEEAEAAVKKASFETAKSNLTIFYE